MQELKTDISAHTSKSLTQFEEEIFHLVVTVCDNARESCPMLPGAMQTLHWPFNDPANATGSDDEKMIVFRQVRDEIKDRIQAFLDEEKPCQMNPPSSF